MPPEDRAPTAGAARPLIGRRGAYAKGRARREEILDRALDVFRERGAAGTSLRAIAQTLGVSHGALLHYFTSREQLLLAVYEHGELRRAAERAQQSFATPVEDIVDSATRNLQVPGRVQLYTTLLAGSLEQMGEEGGEDAGGAAPGAAAAADAPAGESRAYFTRRFERVRARFTQLIAQQQAEGTIRGDVPAEQIAALIVAASDGLQIQWLLDETVALEETLGAFGVLLAPTGGVPEAP